MDGCGCGGRVLSSIGVADTMGIPVASGPMSCNSDDEVKVNAKHYLDEYHL